MGQLLVVKVLVLLCKKIGDTRVCVYFLSGSCRGKKSYKEHGFLPVVNCSVCCFEADAFCEPLGCTK